MGYDKEKIYDDKISPLMGEIIKICKKEGINFVSSFYLAAETEEVDKLYCTTYIDGEEESDLLKQSIGLIYGKGVYFLGLYYWEHTLESATLLTRSSILKEAREDYKKPK